MPWDFSWMMPEISTPLGVYLIVVTLIGGLATWRVQRWLSRSTLRRRRRLLRWRAFEPVGEHPGPQAALETERQEALDRVETDHTVTRRLLMPMMVSLTLIALTLPFLERVSATSLSLVVGALTVVTGIAARPVVENLIAGLVISFSRTLNLGDTVKLGDHYGTVEDITLTHTTIKLWDWRRYVVPNVKMLGSDFLNYTLHDRWIWAYVEFTVAYDTDLDRLETLLAGCLEGSEAYWPEEPPRLWLMDMAPEGVRCWAAAWAEDPGRAWSLAHDLRGALVRLFVKEGIKAHLHRQALHVPSPDDPKPLSPSGAPGPVV